MLALRTAHSIQHILTLPFSVLTQVGQPSRSTRARMGRGEWKVLDELDEYNQRLGIAALMLHLNEQAREMDASTPQLLRCTISSG
eukprot:COSAG02_NODE_528_length_20698_cov_6.231710_2_plen_85_part_00